MRTRSRIAWRTVVLAVLILSVVGGAAGARSNDRPGLKPVRIEWILDDGGFANMRVAVFFGNNQIWWFEVGQGPDDPIKPVYRLGDRIVATICDASSAACNFLTKKHHLVILKPS